MEFFEKAHVAKGGESSKKDGKTEESVKKQLKQMLYGYKKSDNELIKSSIDVKIDNDDSSSVSGFSDLNLTDSSGADDTTRATIGSPESNDSILDVLEAEDSPSKIVDHSDDDSGDDDGVIIDEKEFLNEEVLSEGECLSDELHLGSEVNSSLQSDNESLGHSLKTLSDTESLQEFDPDGTLAYRIHEKLKIKKQVSKRKLEVVEEYAQSIPKNVKSSKKTKKSKVLKLPKVLHPVLKGEDVTPAFISSSESNELSALSPPYISIHADETSLNFDDVLGEYKHSTIKNIAFDNDNLIFPADDSSLYAVKVMTSDGMDMDEEFKDLDADKSQIRQPVIELDSSQDAAAHDSIISVDDTLPPEEICEDVTENRQEDSIKLFFKGHTCVCVMKHPAKMYIHGKFKVTALAGRIEVFGHILSDKVHEIYAPYCNFAQCLSTVEYDNNYFGLFGKLTTIGMSVTDAEDIVTMIGVHDGVLALEPLRSLQMNFVEQFFTVTNLFSKTSKHVDYCHAKALERLGCTIYNTLPRKMFEVPICWQEISKYCYKEQSRGILCGGKGVGKSTCLRYHVNKLIAHGPVLVIDLDIGQSEFTVAGNISATVVTEPLLGPNFTHQRKPERTLNLGMINALDNMRRYVNAVVKLITYCSRDERLRSMRWIVNTMGLCNVVGLHFMTIIILHCQPTYLLQIDSKNPKKRFEIFLRPQLVAAHYDSYKNMRLFANTTCPDKLDYAFLLSHHTETPVRNNNTLAPRDERYLNFLAYFSELLNIYRSTSILEIVPYEVQLQDLCVYMNVKIPEGTVSQVLNGKIVALCQHESGSVTKKTYVLADEPLLCHGHGLIRGIDFEMGILYVITPMPAENLQKVDALLYADWVPELRGQEEQLPAGVVVPYRMPTMHQQKQLMFTPRRRFNPVQLLKMSRGS